MKKHLVWLCFTLVLFCFKVSAQKQTTHIQQLWGAYNNQTRFSEHWGAWLDLHLRTKDDFVEDLSTSIVRAGITYHLNQKVRFTAGYAFVNAFPGDNHPDVSRPEHRPWQQVMWQNPGKRSRFVSYLRLEERFRRKVKDADELADGYNFNYKLRYSTMVNLPLSRNAFAPNTLSVSLNNEIHVNFGKEIVYNYFDQNRFFAGFAYHVNKSDFLQFGYMNLFQQLAAGNQYKMIHAARVYFYHNLDLRKK